MHWPALAAAQTQLGHIGEVALAALHTTAGIIAGSSGASLGLHAMTESSEASQGHCSVSVRMS